MSAVVSLLRALRGRMTRRDGDLPFWARTACCRCRWLTPQQHRLHTVTQLCIRTTSAKLLGGRSAGDKICSMSAPTGCLSIGRRTCGRAPSPQQPDLNCGTSSWR
jgi:hypothetical protein